MTLFYTYGIIITGSINHLTWKEVIVKQINDDVRLRPEGLESYKGQDRVKKSLQMYIEAAKMREEGLDHVLISGPSGLGKTTLANIIANEMGQRCVATSAPVIHTQTDLASILMSVEENDILFIDEIHRLNVRLEEALYFALEDFVLDTKSGSESVRIDLPKFTLIGATTKAGMLSAPMRNRFPITLELQPYDADTLTDIVMRSASLLDTDIDEESAVIIAERSRGIPRIANGFVKRVRDVAMVSNDGVINEEITLATFDMLDIDSRGLTALDRKLMDAIIHRFKLGPVGLTTLCSALDEDKKTIEEAVEPYLIQVGLLEKTPRGRAVTQYGYNKYHEVKI